MIWLPQTQIFKKKNSLFHNANEKLNEHFHPHKKNALENEGCACISTDLQDMVTFRIIQDPFNNLLESSREMNFILFMDHAHMSSAYFQWPIFLFF